jgi:hypothetical protein
MAVLRKNMAGNYTLMMGKSWGFNVSDDKCLIRFGSKDIEKAVDYVYDTLNTKMFAGKTVYKTKENAKKKMQSFFS